jgi:predicted kinase
VAVGGLIASGKSTLAERVGELLDAPVLSADWVRKELAAVSPTEPMHDAPWSGAYTAAATDRVYEELLRRSEHVLSSGRPVVLDASFRSRTMRDAVQALARRHRAPFRFVECRASVAECRQRLSERATSASVSDGRLEIFDEFAARYEPVSEIPEPSHLVVDTSLPIDENVTFLKGEFATWPDGFGG